MVITFSPIRYTLHKIKHNIPPRLKTSLKFVQLYLFLKCTHRLEVLCVIITNTKFHGWDISKRASFHTSLQNAQTKYASPLSDLAAILNCITQGPLHQTIQRFCFWGWTLICCSFVTALRGRQSENWHTQLQNITCLKATTSETWGSHCVSLKAAVMMRRRVDSDQLTV